MKRTKNAQSVRPSAAVHLCNWSVEYLTPGAYWCPVAYAKTEALALKLLKTLRTPPDTRSMRVVHIAAEVFL